MTNNKEEEMTNNKEEEIERLKKFIDSDDRHIKNHPRSHNTYIVKAGKLIELEKLTSDPSYYEQALECYDNAIRISPDNPVYLAKRSNLYIMLGRPDLAAESITKSQVLPAPKDKIDQMYFRDVSNDLFKREDIKKEIKKLETEGKVSKEEAKIFQSLSNDIENLYDIVSGHGIFIQNHDEKLVDVYHRLDSIIIRLDGIEKNNSSSAEVVRSLKSEITNVKDTLQNQQKAINNLESLHTELVNQIELQSAYDKEKKQSLLKTVDNIVKKIQELDQTSVKVINLTAAFKQISEEKENIEDKLINLELRVDSAVKEQNEAKQLIDDNAQYAEQLQIFTQEEFNKLKGQLKILDFRSLLSEDEVLALQHRADQQDKSIIDIDKTLTETKLYDQQQIRQGFEHIHSDEPLRDYAHHFHWFLSNYLLAYRAISTKNVKGEWDKKTLEKVWDVVGSKVVKLTEAIPVVGKPLSLLEEAIGSINTVYKKLEFSRKVEKIKEALTDYILAGDLDLAIASAALKVTKLREKEIHDLYKVETLDTPSVQSKLKTYGNSKIDQISKFVDNFSTKATGIKQVEKTPALKLALKDVALLLDYIASDDIKLTNKDTVKSFDKALTETFMQSSSSSNINSLIADSDNLVASPANYSITDVDVTSQNIIPHGNSIDTSNDAYHQSMTNQVNDYSDDVPLTGTD